VGLSATWFRLDRYEAEPVGEASWRPCAMSENPEKRLIASGK